MGALGLTAQCPSFLTARPEGGVCPALPWTPLLVILFPSSLAKFGVALGRTSPRLQEPSGRGAGAEWAMGGLCTEGSRGLWEPSAGGSIREGILEAVPLDLVLENEGEFSK